MLFNVSFWLCMVFLALYIIVGIPFAFKINRLAKSFFIIYNKYLNLLIKIKIIIRNLIDKIIYIIKIYKNYLIIYLFFKF